MSIDVVVVDLGNGLIEETRTEVIGAKGELGFGSQVTVRILNASNHIQNLKSEMDRMTQGKVASDAAIAIVQKALDAVAAIPVELAPAPDARVDLPNLASSEPAI